MITKKINFYETSLVRVIKQIAKEEIAIAPIFHSYIKPGESNVAYSTQNFITLSFLAENNSLNISL